MITTADAPPRERVSYYLSKAVIDRVDALSRELAVSLGRRVTKADVVDGLLTLGLRHRDELEEAMRRNPPS